MPFQPQPAVARAWPGQGVGASEMPGEACQPGHPPHPRLLNANISRQQCSRAEVVLSTSLTSAFPVSPCWGWPEAHLHRAGSPAAAVGTQPVQVLAEHGAAMVSVQGPPCAPSISRAVLSGPAGQLQRAWAPVKVTGVLSAPTCGSWLGHRGQELLALSGPQFPPLYHQGFKLRCFPGHFQS